MTWQCRRCGRTVDLVLRDGGRCAACAMRTRWPDVAGRRRCVMRALWLPRTRSRSPGHSGQVEHQANRPARASGWATVDQVNRRFAAACAAAGLEGRRTWRESG